MYTFAQATNLYLLSNSAAKAVQSAKYERFYASTGEDLETIFALLALDAGPIIACAWQPSVDNVRQGIQKYTILKARRDEHMPEMFNIIVDFYNRHPPSYNLNFAHFENART